MQNYITIEQDLKKIVNSPRNQNNTQQFIKCVSELKENFGLSISEKWLKNLMSETDKKHKSNNVKYLLKKAGVTIKKEVRYFQEDKSSVCKIEVIEYEHTNTRQIYNHFPIYAFNEDMSLKNFIEEEEILNFKSFGIGNKRKMKLKSKTKRTITGQEVLGLYNAVNSSGVNEKDRHFIQVAKDGKEKRMEILNTIQL